ncbi:MAG: hypothetical protein EOO75_17165, partial [Myxococcales bacterium]
MNPRVRALVLGLTLSSGLLTLSVSPPEAHAQDDATTVEARKRFLEGVKLFDEKKYDLARAAFLQAYALKKHPDVLLNLAQSELMSGKPFEAAGHFKEFLRDTANDKHPKRGDAVRGLDESRQKIGRLQITVDLADAEVLVDGKRVGVSPLSEPLDVMPGQHSVEAKKNGKSATQTVGAVDGKIQIVSLTIEPPTAGVAPVPTGATEPTKTPPTRPAATPAQTNEGKLDITPSTDLSSSGSREPFMRWAGRSPVAYVGAGVTAVGLGLGIGFAIAYNSTKGKADDLVGQITTRAAGDPDLVNYQGRNRTTNPCAEPVAVTTNNYPKACSNLRANLDDTNRNRTVMTVGFVAAGVGVATIIGGYFLTARRSDTASLLSPRLAVTPLLTPDTRG